MTLFNKLLALSVSSFAIASSAHAVEIKTETSAQVSTSTANGGAADDLTITDNGAIVASEVPDFTAVTIDSNNNVVIDGAILVEESDTARGVLIRPGINADLTVSGSIKLIEDYTREDADDDDDADGPLAIGNDRIAIQLQPGAAMTGDILLSTGSIIEVEGNDSAGILLEGPLNGSLRSLAGISVTGDGAQGITAAQKVNGDVTVGGSVYAVGANATGIRLDDGATGTVTIQGAITSTGFTYANSGNYVAPANVTSDTPALEDRIDAEELSLGGPALAVGGSLSGGLLINGAATDPDPSDDESEDETKDTVEDFNENRTAGRLTSYGSAPALLISADWNGPATADLVLGPASETVRDTLDDDDDDDVDEILAVFQNEHGLMNRGAIYGIGTNVGFDGTAVLIEGSESTGHYTRIEGGIYNSGSILATAYEASATSLRLGENAETPLLINSGSIQATMATQVAANAIAVDIAGSASLPELFNSGALYARSTGNAGEVAVVRDLSGTLATITNTGTVTASYASDGIETTIRTDAIAFDLRANTSGVVLHQYEREATYDANGDDKINALDTLDPSITGRILFGSGDDRLLLEGGTITGDVDFGAGADELYASNTAIAGNVSYSGSDAVLRLMNASTFEGDVSFANAGSSQFLISGGSIFKGTISNSGSVLYLAIDSSRAQLTEATGLQLNSLSLTNGTTLILDIDPLAPRTDPVFAVSGDAILSGSVLISPVFSRVSETSSVLTLIDAANILAGIASGDVALTGETPFLYQTELEIVESGRDQLNLVYRLKTTEELGLDVNQSAAFSSVLGVLDTSPAVSRAFAGISSEHDFFQAYDQLLPQRTDASMRFLRGQSNATFGAVADQLNLMTNSPGNGAKGWVRENFTHTEINASAGVPGYNGTGFGLAAGLNLPVKSLDAFGVMVNFNSGKYEEKTGGLNPVNTSGTGLGVYALKKWDNTFLRGTGQVSSLSFSSLRNLYIISGVQDGLPSGSDILDEQDISDEMTATWKGYSYAASAAAGTEFRMSSLYARPELSVDYFSLHQDAYSETALRFSNLALDITAADSRSLSSTALVAIGAELTAQNDLYRIFPEVRVGYRKELSQTPYETTARFQSSEERFLVSSQDEFTDAIIAGFSFNSSSSIFTARLSYDVELSDAGAIHYLGAAGMLRF